ncbi:MAG TPA: CHAT domain-containing protein, partial [Pyrinomonadaceae bacterium]|nr:CHAT domain-containing protein [Pyrinomonadaceae bacterium]
MVRLPSKAGKRKLQVFSGVFYISLACMVCAPLTSAHLVAQNQQTSEQAQQLLATSQEQNQTDHLLALQTAEQALAIFQALGDQDGAAQTRMSIAEYHVAMGNLAEGKKVFETALAYWRQQKHTRNEAATLIELSMIEQRKSDWTNALAYLSQAQPLLNEQTDADLLGTVANSFGFFYMENGWPDLGLKEFERAREYSRRVDPDGRPVYRMTLWIGFTHLLRHDYEAAATNINDALAHLTHPLDKAQCHEFLGRLHIALSQYNLALDNLQTALSSYEAAHNVAEVGRVNAMIGQVQEQQGALAQARKRYFSAAETFQRVQDKFNESAVNFALGKLEMKAGNFDQAETYLKRSVETTEALRPAIGRDVTIAYSATVYDRYQAYIECLVRKAKSQSSTALINQALQVSELARARSLAELLRDTPGNLVTRTNPRLAQRERVLRQAVGARMDDRTDLLVQSLKAEAQQKDSKQFKPQLERVETELSGLQREHAKVVEQLRKTDPFFDQLTQPTAYDAAQIQSEVIDDDQTVLLEFMLGKQSSYAWVVRKKEIKFYELPDEASINAAAQKVYTLLSNKPGSDTDQRLNEATEQLAQMVLRPMAEQLDAKRLIIVADGALHFVPFQLLPSPSDRHEPLIANYEIVNAPSASILGHLRKHKQHRRPGAKLLAAFGDPVFAANYAEHKAAATGESVAMLAGAQPIQNAGWPQAWRDIEFVGDKLDPANIQPLEFSKFELQKLSDLGGATSFVYRGFAASREMLTHLDLSQFSVLHFATHGLFDPKRPESSGLLLSMLDSAGRPQNGFITMADVYSLNAPVDLVVLSACRTGLGKDVRGEGLIGLTSGFMHAGASSVAASLWKVDDQATSELMEHFYSNMLENNMRPADALRAAQNTLRADARWRSPHYWAAFTLQGEYEQTIR